MDSSGSTLITVIVAIAFVTILTTIILGTTVVNVRMKGIDRRTHDDFYYAEKSLNDIYTGIGQEVAVLAGHEYDAALKKVGESDAYSTSKDVENEFRGQFIQKVYNLYKDIDKGDLEEYIQGTSKGKVEKDPEVKCLKKNGEECDADSVYAYRIEIRNVQVSVTDSSQYRSVISTDIIIDIPTLDFLGTNVDVSDYGIIANKGLYILGTGKTIINGNVYAGVYKSSESDYPNSSTDLDYNFYEINDKSSKKDKILGGINIENTDVEFNSNYIISKGDINVAGKNTKVTVNSDAANLSNLWTTSLRTIENHSDPLATSGPILDINANVFALNDLIINAPNSDVKITGNYYGYNDKSVLTELEDSNKSLTVDSSKREDGVSSAIIINGIKSSLDMTGVNNFVLMGKAYIDFTSDNQTDTDAMNLNSLKQVVPTAEGVALKTNQQLYLVPPDFLKEPNPMMESVGTEFDLSISHSDFENWFGYKYLRNYDPDGVNPNSDDFTHQPYTVTLKDGSKVYYDYLVFDENKKWKPVYSGDTIIRYDEDTSDNPLGTGGSVSSKAAFFFEIMNSVNTYDPSVEGTLVQPSAHRLYERIVLSLNNSEYFDLKKCVVGGGATDAHYYAKNAVVNYTRNEFGGLSSTIFSNNQGMGRFLGYPQYLFHRYVHLCTNLEEKEYIPLGLNPDYLKGSSFSDPPNDFPDFSEWKVDTQTPLKHFAILSNIESGADIAANQASANADGIKPTAFGVFIETKPASGELNLGNSDVVKAGTNLFKGVALVNGDIRVPAGMNVDGLLMATGKIILEGSNKIYYNKGLIQSRIEKEMSIVRNSTEADAYKNWYLISYFSNKDGTTRLYDVEPGSKVKRERIEADYNDFMHYENWQKGENDATPTP